MQKLGKERLKELFIFRNSILEDDARDADIHGNLVFEKDLSLLEDSEIGKLGEVGEDKAFRTSDMVLLNSAALESSTLHQTSL